LNSKSEEVKMSKSEQTPQSLITRTLRAAIKVGDDYYTIEETIALPPSANDEQIAQAVDTGLRMYEAQRVAVEQQIRTLREHAVGEPDAPASDKQRSYMDYLLKELNWDYERLAAFAGERMLNLLTLTKREASELIDELKGLASGIPSETAETVTRDVDVVEQQAVVEPEVNHQPILPIGERATQRQVRALERLVEERGIDLEGELRARYGGRPIADLSMDEAGQLLSEWQQRPRQLRPATTRRAA
jgi:hypothetical protein